MIRYAFVYSKILNIFRDMPEIEFPLDPKIVLKNNHNFNIKFLTYKEYADICDIPLSNVPALLGSKCGCTQAIAGDNRYLVLYNTDPACTVPGRIRWTLAHELGHITLGHFEQLSIKESDVLTPRLTDKELELEADYFAATLLCPMPLFKYIGINSPKDIMDFFGLSVEASNNRWNDYLKWQRGHKKTAFENDLLRTYHLRKVSSDSECKMD